MTLMQVCSNTMARILALSFTKPASQWYTMIHQDKCKGTGWNRTETHLQIDSPFPAQVTEARSGQVGVQVDRCFAVSPSSMVGRAALVSAWDLCSFFNISGRVETVTIFQIKQIVWIDLWWFDVLDLWLLLQSFLALHVTLYEVHIRNTCATCFCQQQLSDGTYPSKLFRWRWKLVMWSQLAVCWQSCQPWRCWMKLAYVCNTRFHLVSLGYVEVVCHDN